MSERPLTCKEFVELVTDYLEETMPPALRERFEAHLAVCNGCDVYLRQMKQTMSMLGKLDEGAVPGEVMDKLLSAFQDWKTHHLADSID